jgi:membrane protease YdiL (CAAX protease family)
MRRAREDRGGRRRAARALRGAARTSIAWLAMATVSLLAGGANAPGAPLPGLYAGTVVALWPGPRSHHLRGRPQARVRAAAAALLALGGGAATHAALLQAICGLGLALGLSSPAPRGGAPTSLAGWIALVVLAPVLEETLYRGRLQPACQAYLGPAAAVSIATLAFALPHGGPWPMLGAAVTGGLLGAVRLRVRGIAVCVAIHAGWNLAACSPLSHGLAAHGLAGGAGLGGALSIAIALRLDPARPVHARAPRAEP